MEIYQNGKSQVSLMIKEADHSVFSDSSLPGSETALISMCPHMVEGLFSPLSGH